MTLLSALLVGLTLSGFMVWPIGVGAQQLSRVSVATGGSQANAASLKPSISADGRCIAFVSTATNLVPDNNGVKDVFVHDRQTGQTTRVSVATGGSQANGASVEPAISADGRYIAFVSVAANIAPENVAEMVDVPRDDIFVHDRQLGRTVRILVPIDGHQASGFSHAPVISGDGRYIAFQSTARNLVPGDTNEKSDIFVHDRQMGQTNRVSVATGGGQANGDSITPAISADGRFVAFQSLASNLVQNDTNQAADIFVHDRQTGQTTRASVLTGGGQAPYVSYITSLGAPSISADGRYIAFKSPCSAPCSSTHSVPGGDGDTSAIFVHDRQIGQTTTVDVTPNGGPANGFSGQPVISADGRYVAFYSGASNLISGDTNGLVDVFVRDRQTQQTFRISQAMSGAQANGASILPAISADGRFVAFESGASNLVTGDTNGTEDIFVRVPLSIPTAPTDPQRR